MQFYSENELTASKLIKKGAGHFARLSIHIAGSGTWRLWDAEGPGAAGIIWAKEASLMTGGDIIALDWPFKTGAYLEIPDGGVCSACWHHDPRIHG